MNVLSKAQADLEVRAGMHLFVRLSTEVGALSLGAVAKVVSQLSMLLVAVNA